LSAEDGAERILSLCAQMMKTGSSGYSLKEDRAVLEGK
jgi:hypothetical protein